MIVYTVRIRINSEVERAWQRWMTETHVPEVVKRGKFNGAEMRKVFSTDKDGQEYIVEYRCNSLALLKEYFAVHAPELQKQHSDKFEDKFQAVREISEITNSFD
jgi:hypothetical protein